MPDKTKLLTDFQPASYLIVYQNKATTVVFFPVYLLSVVIVRVPCRCTSSVNDMSPFDGF